MANGTLRYYIDVFGDMLHDIFGMFRLHVVELQAVRTEGENIKTFIFKPQKPIRYQAGQYGVWMLPVWVWGKPVRLFTVAASPTEQTIQVSTRIGPRNFKQKLSRLPIGSKVYMFGPIGRFTFGEQPPAEAVLVAGGIGITPMRALAHYAHDAQLKTKLHLIHSADGYYLYQNELKQLVPDCQFVTKETFTTALSKVAATTSADAVFYISGPPGFVTYAVDELHKHNKKIIKRDGFLGY